MLFGVTTAFYIVITILAIGLLMFVHEGGHYLAARMTGMRVLKFSLGFGPVIFRKQPQGSSTVFQIALIPFLAYVQIAGMNPFEETDPNDEALFGKKSAFARSFVIAAGPIANYLFASMLVFGLALYGMKEPVRNPQYVVVSGVIAGSAAEAAGVHFEDKILAVNGVRTTTQEKVIELTSPRAGQPTVYTIKRGSRSLDITVTPRDDHGIGRIGCQLEPHMRWHSLGVGEAAVFAIVEPAKLTVRQLDAIGDAFVRRTTENFGGPVAMGRQSVEAAERGPVYFLWFIALVSVAIGFFNLLPFPALDGGRLVFLAIELIFRRKVNERIEASVNMVGMLTLLTFMVLITYKDIVHPQ
jgi:regulator of sigma E protease